MIFKMSVKALNRNKFRAFLTMLGVIIGVGAVIAMISLGQGAQQEMKDRISSMGTELLWVMAGSRNMGGIMGGAGTTNTLTVEDFDAILRDCPSVEAVSPTAATAGQLVFGNRNWNTRIEGFNQNFPLIRNWQIASGTFFDERQVKSASRVAVLGRTVAEKLFDRADPIGQTIRIKNMPFRVIGVLAEKGSGMRGDDLDDTVVIPFTTVQKKFLKGTLNVQNGSVKAKPDRASYAEEEITALLRQRHNLEAVQDNDFSIMNLSEFSQAIAATQNVMTSLLASIATVSLIVGGIGIMNIMLVSVSERTREIGIHMSIGARPSHVRLQFLSEAVALCLLGGLIGLAFGVAGSLAISSILGWATVVNANSVVIAILFPAAIGIFFGYYPAHKAALLDPIEALRYE